jgi:hypothetical protein
MQDGRYQEVDEDAPAATQKNAEATTVRRGQAHSGTTRGTTVGQKPRQVESEMAEADGEDLRVCRRTELEDDRGRSDETGWRAGEGPGSRRTGACTATVAEQGAGGRAPWAVAAVVGDGVGCRSMWFDVGCTMCFLEWMHVCSDVGRTGGRKPG